MRRRIVALVALLVAAATLVGGAPRAGGQTSTTINPPTSTTVGPTPTSTTVSPTPTSTTTGSPVQQAQQQLGDLFNAPLLGTYPDRSYEFYYGDGSYKIKVTGKDGSLIDGLIGGLAGAEPDKIGQAATVNTGVPSGKSVTGWITMVAWDLIQWMAWVCRAIVRWLLEFAILKALGALVMMAAGFLNSVVIGSLSLLKIIAILAGFGLAFELLSHRVVGRFLTDLVISVAFFFAATLMIAQPQVYFDGLTGAISQVAQITFRVVDPSHPQTSMNAGEQALKVVGTELPWQYANFGRVLSGPCKDAANQVLAKGPFDNTDPQVRQIMDDAGCPAEAKFNDNPSGVRLAGVLMLLVAVGIILGFILSAAWGMAKAEFRLAWHFTYGAIALLLGSSRFTRDAARSWGRELWHDTLAMVLPSVVLGVMILADSVLLVAMPDLALGFRYFVLCAANAAIFLGRRRAVNAIAAKLNGSIGQVRARKVNASTASIRDRQQQQRDYMPGHRVATLPMLGAVSQIHRLQGTAGKIGGAVGATAKTAKVVATGGASVAKDVAVGVATNTRAAARDASTSARHTVVKATAALGGMQRPRELDDPNRAHEAVVDAYRRAGVDKSKAEPAPRPAGRHYRRPLPPAEPIGFPAPKPEPGGEIKTRGPKKLNKFERERQKRQAS